jgi:sarcosine oxidase, subunit gamma
MSDLLVLPALHDIREVDTSDIKLRALEVPRKLLIQSLWPRTAQNASAQLSGLPSVPNGATTRDPWVLWRAPDEWFAYTEQAAARDMDDFVATWRTDPYLLLTDVSSSFATLELKGARAIDVLMRDCTLDLDGSAVPPGGCARTVLAHTHVMLHRPDSTSWRIFADRSVSRHVWEWLIDSIHISS